MIEVSKNRRGTADYRMIGAVGAETTLNNTGELKILKSKRNLFAIFILTTFALSSCTTLTSVHQPYQYVNVKLDAYSNKENVPPNKKVALMVCNDGNIPKHDLKNIELEGYIKKVLEPKGYAFTKDEKEADIVIFYEYGISDPRYYTSEKIVPVWGVTGIGASVTTSMRQRTPITGRPYTQSTTFNIPSYGQVGERVVTETTIKYLCWVNISAYDADYYRKTGEDKMLWLTEIQSETTSDNLRFVFPYMMAAAKYHIGQNRSNRISYSIPANPVDKEVLELKNTLVTIRINQATKGKKDPQATVNQDVYRDGELIIRAGTPVQMLQKKCWTLGRPGAWRNSNRKTTQLGLDLYNFSTTSVYVNNIDLKGNYLFTGELRYGLWNTGWGFISCSLGALSPIGIPLICNAKKRPKVPAGTLLYLEMEY